MKKEQSIYTVKYIYFSDIDCWGHQPRSGAGDGIDENTHAVLSETGSEEAGEMPGVTMMTVPTRWQSQSYLLHPLSIFWSSSGWLRQWDELVRLLAARALLMSRRGILFPQQAPSLRIGAQTRSRASQRMLHRNHAQSAVDPVLFINRYSLYQRDSDIMTQYWKRCRHYRLHLDGVLAFLFHWLKQHALTLAFNSHLTASELNSVLLGTGYM